MEQQIIRLTRNLHKKLLSLPTSCGILVGWYFDSQIVCVGCCADCKLIPVGLQAVGAFCIPEQNVSDKEAVSLCEDILRQQWENCSDEDVAVILYPQTSEDSLTTDITSLTYSLELGNIYSSEYVLTNEPEVYSHHVLLRAKGSIPVVFKENDNEESLEKQVKKIRSSFCNGLVALHLVDSSILLGHDNSQTLSINDLVREVEALKQSPKSKVSSKRQKHLREKDALTFNIFLQSTNIPVEEEDNHTPLIRYQKDSFKSITIQLPFDVLALQLLDSSASDAYHALTAGLSNQLESFLACVLKFKNKNNHETYEPYCFWPLAVGFPINIWYPRALEDSKLENYRKELHQKLYLPLDRPVLRKLNRFEFQDEVTKIPFLRNTHLGLPQNVPAQGFQISIVYGTYTYHHYMQDRINDDGWGCAYRSLQTIVSWFRHQGYTDKAVPSHQEIQQALVDRHDKPSSFIGSKAWIGSMEISYCLDHLIGVTSKIRSVNSGADVSNLGRELLNHFEVQGTPIMIGGNNLAHTILGVKYNDLTGDIGYLILDPHYTGGEDLHVIQTKEWCGWKGPDFWVKTAGYNLCLPQRPITF